MPRTSAVFIRYGPYESCGVVDHRTFRLEGLQGVAFHSDGGDFLYTDTVFSYSLTAILKDCGYFCVLEKTPDWNQVELVVQEECVYKCNISDLEFGGDGRLDPLCQEAAEAVKNAYEHHQI